PAAPAAQQTGPGVQAPNDAKYRDFVTTKCKKPPAIPAARGARGDTPEPPHREYKVAGIPGIIAGGAIWKTVWKGRGNNADGPVATPDGGMLFAQNTDSKIMKLDKDGKVSFPYENTRTSGSVSINKKGTVYVLERALPQDVLEVAPKRQIHADKYMGEPLDCAGGLVNDMTTDSKGGVYFTRGEEFYADPRGN